MWKGGVGERERVERCGYDRRNFRSARMTRTNATFLSMLFGGGGGGGTTPV